MEAVIIMKINVLKKGDRVISVTSEFVAVQRKNGEVDIVPLIRDETGQYPPPHFSVVLQQIPKLH